MQDIASQLCSRFAMKRLQITVDDDLYAWLTKEIKELRFGSYSHAINYALKHLREETEKERRGERQGIVDQPKDSKTT